MDEDDFQPQPAPPGKPLPERDPGNEHSEALLQAAIERLKARGDSTKRMACMGLPGHVFNDLCARLLDRSKSVRETAEWLAGQVEDAPTRSSVERFSDALFEEYRMAQLADRRRAAENYVAQATAGDPDAQQMALNTRLTELLTDELLRADDAEGIDTKRLMALMMGARTVAQTAFDKQKMDARIKVLETQLKRAQTDLEAKEEKLAAERAAKARALAAATKAAEAGGGGAAVVAAIKRAMGITGEAA